MVKQAEASGIPSDRIMLVGFSQGAVLALAAGLTYDHPLGGICAFSGWLPAGLLATAKHQHTPIFMSHGDQDTLIPASTGLQSAWSLKGAGYTNLQFQRHPKMTHTFGNSEQMEEFRAFVLSKHLQHKTPVSPDTLSTSAGSDRDSSDDEVPTSDEETSARRRSNPMQSSCETPSFRIPTSMPQTPRETLRQLQKAPAPRPGVAAKQVAPTRSGTQAGRGRAWTMSGLENKLPAALKRGSPTSSAANLVRQGSRAPPGVEATQSATGQLARQGSQAASSTQRANAGNVVRQASVAPPTAEVPLSARGVTRQASYVPPSVQAMPSFVPPTPRATRRQLPTQAVMSAANAPSVTATSLAMLAPQKQVHARMPPPASPMLGNRALPSPMPRRRLSL
jgi:hypothetical protein